MIRYRTPNDSPPSLLADIIAAPFEVPLCFSQLQLRVRIQYPTRTFHHRLCHCILDDPPCRLFYTPTPPIFSLLYSRARSRWQSYNPTLHSNEEQFVVSRHAAPPWTTGNVGSRAHILGYFLFRLIEPSHVSTERDDWRNETQADSGE